MRRVVFLSSTGKDLARYRRAVIDHLEKLDHFLCDAQENFGARDACAARVAPPRYFSPITVEETRHEMFGKDFIRRSLYWGRR